MQNAGKKLCAFCAVAIPELAVLCPNCGGSLRSIQLTRCCPIPQRNGYEIVRYGEQFGIALGSEILIHGLSRADLEKARRVVAILNSFMEHEEAG